MIIAVVVILVLIVLGLVAYNVTIHKKIQKFKNMNQKITNLYVVQDFINAIGETSSVEQKIKKINDILIERYEIKYSTIVVFDGAEYQVKASNVDKKHWNALKALQDIDMFKDSVQSWNLEEPNQLYFFLFILIMYILVIGLWKVEHHMISIM